MVLKKKWPFLSKWMGQNFLSIFILTEDVSLCAAAQLSSVQFSSVTQSCPTLWDSMDCSTPGLPIHHQLPEFTQTHVHWVSDANQPSHPLSSPSPLPSVFPSIKIFPSESALHIRWPKYWSFSFNIIPSNEYSGLISFRIDWLDLLTVQGTLKSLLQIHSSNLSILQRSAFYIVQLSHPYMTTRKTIALMRQTFAGKVMSLLFNMLSRLVITFLPRSKRLLISWLQSPSAMILEKWKWSHSVVSDFSWPHGQQPTRLLHPRDFPSKSNGVGCHCLLQVFIEWFRFSFFSITGWGIDLDCCDTE